MEQGTQRKKCGLKTEVFSRVCGYYRPVKNWNLGKKQEKLDRKDYDVGEERLKSINPAPVSGTFPTAVGKDMGMGSESK